MARRAYPLIRRFSVTACCCLIVVLCLVHPVSASPAAGGQGAGSAAADKEFEDKLKSADGYLKTKDFIKAEELFREVFLSVKKGPLSERALFNIGKAGFYLKRYSDARLKIKRFISLYPRSVYLNEAYLLLGYIALNLQKPAAAQQYFEKVGGPLEDRADIGKAEVALRAGNISNAESLIQRLNKRVLEVNPRALYVKAMIYSKKGMHKEAVSTINKVSEPTLKEEDLRFGKALILYNASRFADAEKVCLGITKEPSSNFERTSAKKMLVTIYDAQGKIDDALKLGLEIMPGETDDNFKMKLVRLFEKKGDVTNALRYLNFLQDKSLKSAEIEKRLKGIIESKGAKSMEYVLKFSPYLDQDSLYAVDIARYLITNGRKFEGMALLRRTLRGSAKGEASLYMAELLINEKKYAEAGRFIAPVMLDGRYFSRASYLMAIIFKQEGDYRQAIQSLLKTIKFSRDYRNSALLADLYWEAGDRSSALKYYSAASNAGDGISSVKAGDLYYLSGNRTKSLAFYKRALELGINDPESAQWAYYQYGKLSKDKEYLKKAAGSGGIIGEAAKIIIAGKE